MINFNKSMIALALICLSYQALARSDQKAIYASFDNEFITNKTPEKIKIMATGIGYIIPESLIKNNDDRTILIKSSPLSEIQNVCRNEKFANNLASAPSCSGFLISKDLLVTAGHCFEKKSDCHNLKIIFGVNVSKETSKGFLINKSNVYSCQEIIASIYQGNKDYALIRLNKKVEARYIFKLGDDYKLTQKSQVYMLGHPLGLANTYSKPAPVTDIFHHDIFRTTLDSFAGNSGSPVIDSATDEVVGILAAGQSDLISKNGKCSRFAKHQLGGERATRIGILKDDLQL